MDKEEAKKFFKDSVVFEDKKDKQKLSWFKKRNFGVDLTLKPNKFIAMFTFWKKF